jgi:hypothetical protein
MCVVGSARRRAFKKYNRPLASENVIGEIIGAPRTWPHPAAKPRRLTACGITQRKEAVVSNTAIGGKNLSRSSQMPVWSARARLVRILGQLRFLI